MGYLVRKADAFLREWKKNPDRKPLIIKGARQVGKTETIRTFARENYKNVIEINFITEPSYKVIVEEGFSAEHIIKLISRIDPTKHFEENETLIFFDEIQDFPEIATALKLTSIQIILHYNITNYPNAVPSSTWLPRRKASVDILFLPSS